MPGRADIASTVAIGILLASAPATAMDVVQLPLFGGALMFRGEVGMTEETSLAGTPQLSFWRPVLLGRADRPIGGRMDCKLMGVAQPFSEAAFDVDARYAGSAERRELSGMKDEAPVAAHSADVRRLTVSGEASRPHRHYVLTYLAMRHGEQLYDVRMNCDFTHLQDPGKTDYAALMQRYVSLEPANLTPDT